MPAEREQRVVLWRCPIHGLIEPQEHAHWTGMPAHEGKCPVNAADEEACDQQLEGPITVLLPEPQEEEGERYDYRCPQGHIFAAPAAEHGGPWTTLICPYCGETAWRYMEPGEPLGSGKSIEEFMADRRGEEEGEGLREAVEEYCERYERETGKPHTLRAALLASTPGLSEGPRAEDQRGGGANTSSAASGTTHPITASDSRPLAESASTPGLSDHLHPPPCRSCGVRSQDVSLHAPDCLFRVEAEKARRPLAESASTPERCPRCKTVHPPGYPCPDSA